MPNKCGPYIIPTISKKRTYRKLLSGALKLGVVAACFAVIFSRLNITDTVGYMARTHIPVLLLALVAILVEPFVMAMKWYVLLRQKNIEVPVLSITRIIFASNFLGIIVPNTLGIDAIRVYMLKQKNNDYIHTTGTLVTDRLMGVCAMCLLPLIVVPIISSSIHDASFVRSVVVVCAAMLAGVALVVSPLAGMFLAFTSRLCLRGTKWAFGGSQQTLGGRLNAMLEGTSSFVNRVHESVRDVLRAPLKVLLLAFLLNVSMQLLRVIQIHCVFRSIGVSVPVLQELAFVPVIMLISMLPISFLGLGVKEGAFIFFFGLVGVANEASLAASLLTYPLMLLVMLPGAFFIMAGDRTKVRQAMEAESQKTVSS